MAETVDRIERSYQQFRKNISPQENQSLQAVSIDDVRHAVRQVERQLAAANAFGIWIA